MDPLYSDLRARLGEPDWLSDGGVPRYGEFDPAALGIYHDRALLFSVSCQACGAEFRVARCLNSKYHGIDDGNFRPLSDAEVVRELYAWGDAPWHTVRDVQCPGTTTSAEMGGISGLWIRENMACNWRQAESVPEPAPHETPCPIWHPGVFAQGSKRIGRNRKTGTAILIDDSTGLKPWRNTLRDRMGLRMKIVDRPDLLPSSIFGVPVRVHLDVVTQRPKTHYGTRNGFHRLKDDAPTIPIAGLDLDKVQRAIGDAGTGVWWKDDAHIAAWRPRRAYAPAMWRKISGEVEHIDQEGILVWCYYWINHRWVLPKWLGGYEV